MVEFVLGGNMMRRILPPGCINVIIRYMYGGVMDMDKWHWYDLALMLLMELGCIYLFVCGRNLFLWNFIEAERVRSGMAART